MSLLSEFKSIGFLRDPFFAEHRYKSDAYKNQMTTNPRESLREFGVELDEKMEIFIVDSTADVRYLVIPRRPPNTTDLSEEELAQFVTRDSMIGVGEALAPFD